MVLSSWKSCVALVASAVMVMAGSGSAVETFTVPSFDFVQLLEGQSLVLSALSTELQSVGIVSIRNIPGFNELRTQYLDAATHCASSAEAKANPGLLYKTLSDGTERWTISTKTQVDNAAVASTKLSSVCPDYLPALEQFNQVVNAAAWTFAHSLDSAAPSLGNKLEDVVLSAQNLDHFHSYSSPSAAETTTASASGEPAVSLDLHTDNGVMIFMTAPEFYALRETGPVKVAREAIVSGPDASAGLLIKVPGKAELVQPVLKDDELVVMIGEGFNSWITTGLNVKPVLHAMKMPSFSPELGKVSRSWFGKMILLPKDRIMKNTGITFGDYADKVIEYVIGNSKDANSFSTLACPPTMKLFESDASCALKIYEPKPGNSATKQQCANWCNSSHSTSNCSKNCNYVGTVPDGGIDCWMLCLPNDSCGAGLITQCDPNGDTSTVCVNATATA